jgi:hypothetical protein
MGNKKRQPNSNTIDMYSQNSRKNNLKRIFDFLDIFGEFWHTENKNHSKF